MRPKPRLIALTAVLAALGVAAPAYADSTRAGAAEALFREGKALMAAKNFASACPKLVESQRLDPGTGTLLVVALCHEAEGKTASAWAEFGEALSAAKRDERSDRVTLATAHIKAHEPRLSRLIVHGAPELRNPGVVVQRDGFEIGAGAFDAALPVDPGEHVVEASAPGMKPWRQTVTVAAGTPTTEISIPALEPGAADAAAAAAPATAVSDSAAAAGNGTAPSEHVSGARIAAYTTAGIGAVALVASAVLAGIAYSNGKDAKQQCPNGLCPTEGPYLQNENARREANATTVLVSAGGGLVAIGAVLYFALPATSPVRHVETSFLPGGGTVGYSGRF